MYVFVLLVCLLHLAAAAQGQVGEDCKGHNKFTECACNQYGVSVHRDDKLALDEEGIVVHTRTDLPQNSKKP